MSVPPGAWFRQVKAANFPRGPVAVAEAFYKYARLQRGIHNVGPGLKRLMSMTGYSRASVTRHVATLVEHGWLYQTEEGHHGQIARFSLVKGSAYVKPERCSRRCSEGAHFEHPRRESLVVPSQRELPTRPEEHQETAEREAAPRRAAVVEMTKHYEAKLSELMDRYGMNLPDWFFAEGHDLIGSNDASALRALVRKAEAWASHYNTGTEQ